MLVRNDIVEAIVGNKPIGQIYSGDFRSALSDMVERLYALKAIDYNKSAASLIVDELEYTIAHSYPSLTIPELKIALEAGVSGEWRNIGSNISVASCIGWVRSYFTSDDRTGAREAINEMNRRASSGISLEEIMARNKKTELEEPDNAYQRYLAEGRSITFAGYAAMVYDSLVKHGKMNPSEEARKRAEKAALVTMKKANGLGSMMRGQNSPVFESYVKLELLYAYFENLKSRNVNNIKIS